MKISFRYFNEADVEILPDVKTAAQCYVKCVYDSLDENDAICRKNFLENLRQHPQFPELARLAVDEEVLTFLKGHKGEALRQYICTMGLLSIEAIHKIVEGITGQAYVKRVPEKARAKIDGPIVTSKADIPTFVFGPAAKPGPRPDNEKKTPAETAQIAASSALSGPNPNVPVKPSAPKLDNSDAKKKAEAGAIDKAPAVPANASDFVSAFVPVAPFVIPNEVPHEVPDSWFSSRLSGFMKGSDSPLAAALLSIDVYMRIYCSTDQKAGSFLEAQKLVMNFIATHDQLPGWRHTESYIKDPRAYLESIQNPQVSEKKEVDKAAALLEPALEKARTLLQQQVPVLPPTSIPPVQAPITQPLSNVQTQPMMQAQAQAQALPPSPAGLNYLGLAPGKPPTAQDKPANGQDKPPTAVKKDEVTIDQLQAISKDLLKKYYEAVRVFLEQNKGKVFHADVFLRAFFFTNGEWAKEAQAFIKKAEVTVTQMLTDNQEKFAAFREIQRKGVTWPHSGQARKHIEAYGFVFRPMMIKRDRCICESCLVEIVGWKIWHNPLAFHVPAKHGPFFSFAKDPTVLAVGALRAKLEAEAKELVSTPMPAPEAKPAASPMPHVVPVPTPTPAPIPVPPAASPLRISIPPNHDPNVSIIGSAPSIPSSADSWVTDMSGAGVASASAPGSSSSSENWTMVSASGSSSGSVSGATQPMVAQPPLSIAAPARREIPIPAPAPCPVNGRPAPSAPVAGFLPAALLAAQKAAALAETFAKSRKGCGSVAYAPGNPTPLVIENASDLDEALTQPGRERSTSA